MSKKKILLVACYSIGIVMLISGNSSSHPECRTSEIFLSLYVLVLADCLCFQTFTLFRVGKSVLTSFTSSVLSLSCPGRLSRQIGSAAHHGAPHPRSVILQCLLCTITSILCLFSAKLDLHNYSC